MYSRTIFVSMGIKYDGKSGLKSDYLHAWICDIFPKLTNLSINGYIHESEHGQTGTFNACTLQTV